MRNLIFLHYLHFLLYDIRSFFVNLNWSSMHNLVQDGLGFSKRRLVVPCNMIRKCTTDIKNILASFASTSPSLNDCLYSLLSEKPYHVRLDTSIILSPIEIKSLCDFLREIRRAVWLSNDCKDTLANVSDISTSSGYHCQNVIITRKNLTP